MSHEDDHSRRFDPDLPPLVSFWTSTFAQTAQQTHQMLDTSAADPRVWRRRWLDTLGQTTDAYLRSPIFLQMLKTHIDCFIQAKQQSNAQQEKQTASGSQMAQDLQSMRSQLEQLKQQLDEVETLLGARPEDAQADSLAATPDSPDPGTSRTENSSKGVMPCEVVYSDGTLRLFRYANSSVKFAEPVLICFALVNRPYILDLQEDRSVVRRLLDRGFDVYLIDWGRPHDSDSHLRLEDYVGRLLAGVVNFVCEATGTKQLNLLGYCMGGTMSTMYTALWPKRVRNLILMATPIDFGGDQGLLNLWAREEYFDVDRLVDTFGNCPGEFLQFVFQLMKPVQNFAEKQIRFCENVSDPAFVDNFVALERWAGDSIPVAGDTFRQYVKMLYQQNQLIEGQMRLADEPVMLRSIGCPLLLLVAEKDHLVVPQSTLALKQYVSSKEVQSISINAGHVGLAVSSKAHRDLWPAAANWIANHSTEL